MIELMIGFSRPKRNKIFSRLIILLDKMRYNSSLRISHCFGVFTFQTEGQATNWIYQASKVSTNFESQERFQKSNSIIELYKINVSSIIAYQLLKICVEREGKGYGIPQILGTAIVNIFWFLSFKKLEIKNPFSDGDDRTTCVEEWGRILSQVAPDVFKDVDLDTISVKPFRDLIASMPQAELYSNKVED